MIYTFHLPFSLLEHLIDEIRWFLSMYIVKSQKVSTLRFLVQSKIKYINKNSNRRYITFTMTKMVRDMVMLPRKVLCKYI